MKTTLTPAMPQPPIRRAPPPPILDRVRFGWGDRAPSTYDEALSRTYPDDESLGDGLFGRYTWSVYPARDTLRKAPKNQPRVGVAMIYDSVTSLHRRLFAR